MPSVLPLKLLLKNGDNRYEVAVATMRRAQQLSITAEEEIEADKSKVVSIAVGQIVSKKVKYQVIN